MKRLLQVFLCIALAGFAGAAAPTVAPASSSAYLSFVELHRLTVNGVSVVEFGGAPEQAPQLPNLQIRVASTEAQQPAQLSGVPAFAISTAPERVPARFSYSTTVLPEPSRWLL